MANLSPAYNFKFRSLFIIALVCLLGSCKHPDHNPVFKNKIGKISSVTIIGNSIVRHSPTPEIGWPGSWGMAASAEKNDFVHILIARIVAKAPGTKIRFVNISEFEQHFTTFDLLQLDSLRNSDMVIVRLSENVENQTLDSLHFITYYDSLINYLDPHRKAVRVIVDGFWDKVANMETKQYARDHQLPFVKNVDLSSDTSNLAGARFTNNLVKIHPSDKGMRMIADRIWEYIGQYF